MTMPNFFVAGAPKAGTNTLISALATHPEVFVPRDLKEPMFFFWYGCDVQYHFMGRPPVDHAHHRDLAAYRKLFAGARGEAAVGEGSVHYFASERAAANIRQLVPDARVIVLLRDPVERALSHHGFNVMRGIEDRDFTTAVAEELDGDPGNLYPTYRYVGNGLYGRHLGRYLEMFPPESVLPLLFEDLVADPAAVVGRAEAFLGVSEGASRVDGGFRNETVSGGPMLAVTRHLRRSEGWLGRGARRIERAAGANPLYRSVKQKLMVTAKRGAAAPAEKPDLSGATRDRLVESFRADREELARLSGLDLSAWDSATR